MIFSSTWPGFHLGLKVRGKVWHAAKCLATPIFVAHTPYYMLVYHGRSSYILLFYRGKG